MNWMSDRFQQFGQQLIAVGDDGSVTYKDFAQKIAHWHAALRDWEFREGDRVGLVADYHIDVVALVIALIETKCIVIPLSEDDHNMFDERLETASATKLITVNSRAVIDADSASCRNISGGSGRIHPLMTSLLDKGSAGFVIYTSGSTGKSKAVLLDYNRMTKKYQSKVRESFRTLLFLKLDHIGGMNTLFSVIFNGGTIVTSSSRQAKDICASIERHQVELLPTTPSFLTMLLMSGMHRNYDLSSLKVITYGTEVMPDSTLASIGRIFPGVVLKQTYGLSELGILSTKSRSSASKWMKIGGDGFEVQVRDNILWIRSEQAMLGYLNADSPFDSDGWYNTGDRVEVDGDYYHILGRQSEIINVAGEKVFPIEIESFLLTLDNVKDVIVKEKKSPVTGQMVWADFLLDRDEDPIAFKQRIIAECKDYFPPFKVPGFITISNQDALVGSRYKKIRKVKAETSL